MHSTSHSFFIVMTTFENTNACRSYLSGNNLFSWTFDICANEIYRESFDTNRDDMYVCLLYVCFNSSKQTH